LKDLKKSKTPQGAGFLITSISTQAQTHTPNPDALGKDFGVGVKV
jgi:hypothetical protein